MTLRRQIIHFVRTDGSQQAREIAAVGHVGVMQEEPVFALVQIRVDAVHTARVEAARTTFQPVYFVAFTQQKLDQVRSVLAGHTRNQSALHVKEDP